MSKYNFNPVEYKTELSSILQQIDSAKSLDETSYAQIVKSQPKDDQGLFAKSEVIAAYKRFHEELR